MPHLVLAETARRKLRAIWSFYAVRDERVAKRAIDSIVAALQILMKNPQVGRPHFEDRNHRELIIPFGAQGFIALYRVEDSGNVVVLTIRHQREQNYPK